MLVFAFVLYSILIYHCTEISYKKYLKDLNLSHISLWYDLKIKLLVVFLFYFLFY